MKLFFSSSHKDMSWNVAKKIAYHSFISYIIIILFIIPLCEVVLPNTYFKITQLQQKVTHEAILKKKAYMVKLSCAKWTLIAGLIFFIPNSKYSELYIHFDHLDELFTTAYFKYLFETGFI